MNSSHAPTGITPDAFTSAQDSPRFGRYLCWIALFSILLYLLPFLLVRAPHFDQWTYSAFGRDIEYGFNVRHVDADVLVFGDSTALYGIDTNAMSAALGSRVFNLPGIQPSVTVTHDIGLQHYLQHNRPPRVIVLYFAPWDLDFITQKFESATYDGDEMLLRHGTPRQLVKFYRTHLDQLLSFPFRFYRVQSFAGLRYLIHPRPGPPPMSVSGGHRPIADYPALLPNCAFPPSRTLAGTASIRQLVARYTSQQTRVLVYVSPVADCRGAERLTRSDYTGFPAAPPRLLPSGDFVRDGFYVHPLPAGVQLATAQLTEAVRPLLEQPVKK